MKIGWTVKLPHLLQAPRGIVPRVRDAQAVPAALTGLQPSTKLSILGGDTIKTTAMLKGVRSGQWESQVRSDSW